VEATRRNRRKPSEYVTARLDRDTLKALQARAHENDRTVSAEVRRAIKQYLGLEQAA
jgi:predicted transcriptional regulator